MFLETFIKRPILSSVCSVIILLLGLISIAILPVEYYPEMAPTQIYVSATYTGADATTVESTVTTPLEKAINGARGMKFMQTSSGNDGSSTINITFDSTRNADDALLDVQTRVKEIEPMLPNEVKSMGISISKTSTAMTLMYVLEAKNNEYDEKFLSNYADRFIRDYIQRVNGVARVEIYGEENYAMRIWIDPYKLASRNLTTADVVSALEEQNAIISAGQIGTSPSDKNQKIQMTIQAKGRLETPQEFEDIVLKTQNGLSVRLKDVARVELGSETYSSSTKYNGKNAIVLAVLQLNDANAIEVATGVKKQIEVVKKMLPAGLELTLIIDATMIVKESIKEAIFTLMGSIILVILVIFIFLQKLKTTIIPSIAIPVSLLGSFLLMRVFGFSINTLTLFGIVLATGLVVDDAIIVVENIERYMKEKNLPPYQAALAGMKEIFGAVIATSLVLICVFVPITFFPGLTGQLYKQFALTIAFSILFSAFVSITLTPAMAAKLIENKPQKQWIFFDKFNSWLSSVIKKYEMLLNKVIANKRKVYFAFIFFLILTALLFKIVPKSFVPEEDQAYFTVLVQAPEGYSLENTKKISKKVKKALDSEKDDIIGFFDFAGYSMEGISPNKAMMYVILKPNSERKGKLHSSDSIVNRMNEEFSKIPDATIMAFGPSAIEGIGTVGGFQFEIKDEGSHSLEELKNVVQDVITQGNKSSKLQGLYTSFVANNPQYNLQIDKLKIKEMGLNLKDVYDTLQVALGSYYINDFTYLNKSYRVYAQADSQFRSEISDIGQLYVRNNEGKMIPVSNLINHKMSYGADTISHYNLRRSAEITGDAASGVSLGEAVKEMEAIAAKVLPKNYSYEWSGIVLEQQNSDKLTGYIFIFSLVFVFLILAALYENLFSPVIILLAVPLAMFGAMAFQFIRGLDNDVFCQIGLVMLIGLASKNAILIVEFANQLKEQGKTIVEAVIKASVIRFRPIMMTSLACIMGIFPLVVAQGVGSQSRISMGTAVFGGMIVSTLLNLFVTPILYIAIMNLQEKIKEKMRK